MSVEYDQLKTPLLYQHITENNLHHLSGSCQALRLLADLSYVPRKFPPSFSSISVSNPYFCPQPPTCHPLPLHREDEDHQAGTVYRLAHTETCIHGCSIQTHPQSASFPWTWRKRNFIFENLYLRTVFLLVSFLSCARSLFCNLFFPGFIMFLSLQLFLFSIVLSFNTPIFPSFSHSRKLTALQHPYISYKVSICLYLFPRFILLRKSLFWLSLAPLRSFSSPSILPQSLMGTTTWYSPTSQAYISLGRNNLLVCLSH